MMNKNTRTVVRLFVNPFSSISLLSPKQIDFSALFPIEIILFNLSQDTLRDYQLKQTYRTVHAACAFVVRPRLTEERARAECAGGRRGERGYILISTASPSPPAFLRVRLCLHLHLRLRDASDGARCAAPRGSLRSAHAAVD